MFENFYDEVQDRMVSPIQLPRPHLESGAQVRGDERTCVVTNLIEQQQNKNLSHQESVWLAGTMQ
jgi:hypothetical protein